MSSDLINDGPLFETPPALLGTTWTTQDGRVLEVSEMTPQHARYTINMLEGRSKTRHTIGDFLQFYADWPQADRLSAYPLGQALYARAGEKPSLTDRRNDHWNKVRWRLRRSPGVLADVTG